MGKVEKNLRVLSNVVLLPETYLGENVLLPHESRCDRLDHYRSKCRYAMHHLALS